MTYKLPIFTNTKVFLTHDERVKVRMNEVTARLAPLCVSSGGPDTRADM